MTRTVTYERKIRYSDTDAQGIVFNGNYATYFDDAVTDLFDDVAIPEGVEVVLRRMEIDFLSTGRFGETLVTRAAVDGIGRTSFTIRLETTEMETGRPVAAATQVQVTTDADFQPIPVPDAIRGLL